MSYTEFMKDLDKDTLKPVYLFHGSEMYLVDHVMEKLQNEKIAEAYADFNWTVFDGSVCEIDEIIGTCETLPFFDERKVVVVKNAPFFGATKTRLVQDTEDELIKYLKAPSETTLLIFVSTSKPDKRKKLYKALAKAGDAIEFGKLDDRTFPKWMQKIIIESGKTIDPGTLYLLSEQTGYLEYGSDKTLYDVKNMLQKVIGFCGDKTKVEALHIETMIEKPLEKSVFDMVDALGSKRAETAFKISHKLFAEGEAPIKIMAMITRHFRLLYKTKLYMEEGYTPSALASKLKLPAFVVKKNAAQIRTFSLSQLKNMLDACAETEFKVKTGQYEGRLAVETLMVKLGRGGVVK